MRTLEQAVAAEDRKRRLSEALEQIKDEYRIAIHLVYLEEMSYDDAGKIMGEAGNRLRIWCIGARKRSETYSAKRRSFN